MNMTRLFAPSVLFNYVTVIGANATQPPWLMDQHVDDRRVDGDRLVGLNPLLTMSSQSITLTATSRERARYQAAAFDVAPGLLSYLRAGDIFQVARGVEGGVALVASRDGRLLFAVGSLSQTVPHPIEVSVGPNPFSERSSKVDPSGSTPFWSVIGTPDRTPELAASWLLAETWIEVRAGTESVRVHQQEEATVGEYTVVVERSFRFERPRVAESVAIFRSSEPLHEVLVASAKSLPSREVRSLRWPAEKPMRLFVASWQGVMYHAEIAYGYGYVECRYVRGAEVLFSQRVDSDREAERWILSELDKISRDSSAGPVYPPGWRAR
jgi:hypothetical protein